MSRKNQTYSIDEEVLDALALMSVLEKRDKAEIVRQAVSQYIPKRYFDLVKEMREVESEK